MVVKVTERAKAAKVLALGDEGATLYDQIFDLLHRFCWATGGLAGQNVVDWFGQKHDEVATAQRGAYWAGRSAEVYQTGGWR